MCRTVSVKQEEAIIRAFLALVILLFITLTAVRADDELKPDVIQIATEEYAPFTSESLKHYGVINHIISEAFRLEGFEVKYHFLPAARSFKSAKDGILDGTTPWAHRPDREINFLYSDPILDVGGEYFFYKKGFKFDWDPATVDYSRFKGASIGAIISYDYGSKFQEAEKHGLIHVVRVSKLKQLFRMLLRDRIDLVISKVWVAKYDLQTNFAAEQIAQITSQPENNEPPSYDYVLFPKKKPGSQHLRDSLNKGLKKLRASGTYDAFLNAFEDGGYVLPQKVN